MNQKKITQFLDTATPQDIMEFWKNKQPRKRLKQNFVALFSDAPKWEDSKKPWPQEIVRFIRIWWKACWYPRRMALARKSASAWKIFWRVGDPPTLQPGIDYFWRR